MATQHGIFQFTGKLGNVVGTRTRSGKFVIRPHSQVPKEVWETAPNFEPNRRSASAFGEASRFAAHIRHGLMPYLDHMADGRLHNRLQSIATAALTHLRNADPHAPLDALHIAPVLRNFSLRADLDLLQVVQVSPQLLHAPHGHHSVHIPAPQLQERRFSKVKVDLLRWHLACVPMPLPGVDMAQHPARHHASPWMPLDALADTAFQFQRLDGEPPLLIALGLESAQGAPSFALPLRTVSVMEILDVV